MKVQESTKIKIFICKQCNHRRRYSNDPFNGETDKSEQQKAIF